ITRHPMSPTWPLEVLNTLTLTEQDGKTTLVLRGRPINATEGECKTFEGAFEGMQKGFAGTFDQLETYLAKA
ncbi:MAG TPA: SRPBCC domain-containing protein, partial [Opitutaceae bacterium]|nr:SRPBCC domain-containing protein [Opitutaceae bacterium]